MPRNCKAWVFPDAAFDSLRESPVCTVITLGEENSKKIASRTSRVTVRRNQRTTKFSDIKLWYWPDPLGDTNWFRMMVQYAVTFCICNPFLNEYPKKREGNEASELPSTRYQRKTLIRDSSRLPLSLLLCCRCIHPPGFGIEPANNGQATRDGYRWVLVWGYYGIICIKDADNCTSCLVRWRSTGKVPTSGWGLDWSGMLSRIWDNAVVLHCPRDESTLIVLPNWFLSTFLSGSIFRCLSSETEEKCGCIDSQGLNAGHLEVT